MYMYICTCTCIYSASTCSRTYYCQKKKNRKANGGGASFCAKHPAEHVAVRACILGVGRGHTYVVSDRWLLVIYMYIHIHMHIYIHVYCHTYVVSDRWLLAIYIYIHIHMHIHIHMCTATLMSYLTGGCW